MDPSEQYTRSSTRVNLTKHRNKLYYKFLCPKKKFVCSEAFTAKVINLSEGGALICGTLPSLRLMSMLGNEDLYIGCIFPISIFTADGDPIQKDIRFLGRLRWAATDACAGLNCHQMGLEFIKISPADKQDIKSFLIRTQILDSKSNRTTELLNPGSI